jgi:hypothetical protein
MACGIHQLIEARIGGPPDRRSPCAQCVGSGDYAIRIMPPLSESLIYLSETKLWNMARSRGISTAQFEFDFTAEVAGGVRASLTPRTSVSAAAHAEARHVDPQQRERAMDRMLNDVVVALRKDGLADLDLDYSSQTPRDGGWFRFHRDLRFGYGSADDNRSVSALVLVDREPVGEPGRAGLLMNGSPWHLREPYRPPDGAQIAGARSGSSTGRLFRWWLLHNPGPEGCRGR